MIVWNTNVVYNTSSLTGKSFSIKTMNLLKVSHKQSFIFCSFPLHDMDTITWYCSS